MFGIFVADTVPVILEYFTHATKLYGDTVKELILSNDKILIILQNYKRFLNISNNIKSKLISEHSYEIRLKELIKFV